MQGVAAKNDASDDLSRARASVTGQTTMPNPEFTWAPDCPMLELTVVQDRTVMWTVFGEPPANQLEAPVRYGVTPPGFTAPTPAALVPTIPYEVVLFRIDAEGTAVVAGRRSFLGAAP